MKSKHSHKFHKRDKKMLISMDLTLLSKVELFFFFLNFSEIILQKNAEIDLYFGNQLSC